MVFWQQDRALARFLGNRWEQLSIDDAVAEGVDAFVQAYATDEPRKYMDAFFAKARENAGDTITENEDEKDE